MIYVGKMGCSF